MTESQANYKRVAKNTLMLYCRHIVLLLIGLYTSRVILQSLGVENYGINNVIAGFLSMFGIVTISMNTAIARFITVELGHGNIERLKKTFSTSICIQFLLGLLIVALIEIFGSWFVSTKMVIPEGREFAAQCCLHCAAITTFISLMNVPITACIVAHERMSAFAYMGILDAVLKLLICYVLYITPWDVLITFSCLGIVVSVITSSIYWLYSFKQFKETTLYIELEKNKFKEMWVFASWNVISQASWLLNTSGVDLLMNTFFGVVVNAARGVAGQVNGILMMFVSNFMMALNPQITKSYASGDKNTAFGLACRGARFSFYILFILSLPIMIESNQILSLWLVNPPPLAAVFVTWTILSTFSSLLGNTLSTLQMAHGNIKKFQLYMSLIGCVAFPLTWIAFKLGASPLVVYYIMTVLYVFLIFVRYYLVHQSTGIPPKMYLIGVVLRTHCIAFLSAIIPVSVYLFMPETIVRLLIVGVISISASAISIYYLGIEKGERTFINEMICKYNPLKTSYSKK